MIVNNSSIRNANRNSSGAISGSIGSTLVNTSSPYTHGWNNNGNLVYSTHSDFSALLSGEASSISKAKSEIEKILKDEFLIIQGATLELQRQTGITENYDNGLFNQITQSIKIIKELQEKIELANEKIKYLLSILESIEAAQKLLKE